jgi:hypothetical protein
MGQESNKAGRAVKQRKKQIEEKHIHIRKLGIRESA